MTPRLFASLAVLGLGACLAAAPRPATAAPSYDGCTGFIDTVGTVVTTPGTWCLRQDLATSGAGGDAISIATSDVVIDCNGHSVAFTGGRSDVRNGIYAYTTRNVSVRNCVVRGFRFGIVLEGSQPGIGAHVVEDNVVEGGSYVGIRVDGDGSVVRRNRVADIGGLEASSDYYGIETSGSVDVLDNTVHDMVTKDNRVWGIAAYTNAAGSIRGNRIRGLSGYYAWGAIGIWVAYSGHVSVRENDISGTMVQGMYPSVGVLCFNNDDGSSNVRVSDNVIGGYPTMQQSCVDVGDNDFSL
jgi:Right handed beta helix region